MKLLPHELAFLDRHGCLVIVRDPRYRIVLMWRCLPGDDPGQAPQQQP